MIGMHLIITEMVKAGADPVKASCAVHFKYDLCSNFNVKEK